jgi:hypothetical protein
MLSWTPNRDESLTEIILSHYLTGHFAVQVQADASLKADT